MYSVGIDINDGYSALYTNRAKCHKMLGRTVEALADIQSAIDLDDVNIKAYLIQGQLLAEQAKTEESIDKAELAVLKITKALRLCTSLDKAEYKNDILVFLRRAKKLLWYKKYTISEKTKKEAIEQYRETLTAIPNIT